MTLPKPVSMESTTPRFTTQDSLDKPREAIALLTMLWYANGKPSTVTYGKAEGAAKTRDVPDGDGILDDGLRELVYEFAHELTPSLSKESTDAALTVNPLVQNQVGPLDTAFKLFWHLGRIYLTDYPTAMTKERNGGKRYRKTIEYSTNLDILDTLISTDYSAYMSVFISWFMGSASGANEDCERRIIRLLTVFSENAYCKTRSNDNGRPAGILYVPSGVYDSLTQDPAPVMIYEKVNESWDYHGPTRILNAAISNGLHAYLAKSGSGSEVKLADGVAHDEVESYSDRAKVGLTLSRLNLDGNVPELITAEENQDDVEAVRFEFTILPTEFNFDFARRYITSLLAKPFVILTGNSGTGKTRISKRFAEYLEVRDEEDEPNWLLVPVGADWTDNTKVLGFYNPLASVYEETGILRLIERANAHPDIPYFLILDEMNLSHVERYFSDFLSHMETGGGDNLISLDGYENGDEEGNTSANLTYPKNLFVIGTVNIDETTYMFSPKVLDRANVIEFKPDRNDVLAWFSTTEDTAEAAVAAPGIAQSFLSLAEEIQSDSDHINTDDSVIITDIFGKLYDALEKCGFEFAFRTVREVRRYINAAHEFDGEDFDLERSTDEQIVQKVLPKLHGNKREIGNLLEELATICEGKPLSTAKINQMKVRLANVQYASFI